MSDLEDRLRSWFASEVARAERDLPTTPVGAHRVHGRRRVPAFAVAGLTIAVVALALGLRPIVAPDAGKGPLRSPARTPLLAGETRFGSDGVPTVLNGEPVFEVGEARDQLSEGPGPLLVRGWYLPSNEGCLSEPAHPLLRDCGNGRLLPNRGSSMITGIELVVEPADLVRGKVVLRLHAGDPRAATCPPEQRARCERVVIVDEVAWANADPLAVRYADGIPVEIDGERVIRPHALADTQFDGDTRFLLGGWHGQSRWFGCGRLGEEHPLLDDCSPEWIAEAPGGPGAILMLAREIPDGPVVIRVHTNDPRSATCPELERLLCAERLVVDELVWAGDAVTKTEPLRIDNVVTALRQDIPDLTLKLDRPSRACDPGWPEVSWVSLRGTGITNVLAFPTIGDREAVDQNFRSSGWTGIDGCSVDLYGDPWHWVAVDNVMVSHTDANAERTRLRLEAMAP
jgi:hypothetical protein